MKSTIRYSQHSAKVDKGNNVDPTCQQAITNICSSNRRRIRKVTPSVDLSSDFARKLAQALKGQ